MLRDRVVVNHCGMGNYGIRTFAAMLIAVLLSLWSVAGEVQAASFTNLSSARFVNLSSMGTPRFRHTATLLNNGRVLVAGGAFNNFSTPTSTAQVYDPKVGKFAPEIPLPLLPRFGHTATMLRNGKVLLAGGRKASSPASAIQNMDLYDPALNTVTASGFTLTIPRYNHTATVLNDGRVMFAGGYDATGTPTNSVEIFDPASNVFVSAPLPLATRRGWHSATLLPDGRVVIIGGIDQTGARLTSIEIYTPPGLPTPGTVTMAGVLSAARAYHAAVLRPADGKIIVIGGASALPCDIVDPIAGTVAAGPSLPTLARYEPTATLLPNGDLVVVGGISPGPGTTQAIILTAGGTAFQALPGGGFGTIAGHTATMMPDNSILVVGGKDTYTTFQPQRTVQTLILTGIGNSALNSGLLMPAPTPLSAGRKWHTSTILPNGKVLIAGGMGTSTGDYHNTGVIYDPAARTFTQITSTMSNPRYGHTATLLSNGTVLLAGGNSTGGLPVATADLYDPVANTFTPLTTTPMGFARAYHTATLLADGRVLIAGGKSAAGQTASIEIFTPGLGFSPATALLANARFNHTATLLKNGNVLFTGGEQSTPTITFRTDAEIYVTATGLMDTTFISPSNQMTSARTAHAAAPLPDGNILIAGGTGSTAEIFDTIANSFHLLTASMSAGSHSGCSATVMNNGKVVMAGGVSNAAIDIFDPASKTFSNATTLKLSSPRAFHAASLLDDGTVLFTGGDSGGAAMLASADIYESGIAATRRPVITPLTNNIPPQPLQLSFTGTLFTGDSEGSGAASPSPTNYPVLTIQKAQDGGVISADANSALWWSPASFSTAVFPLTAPQGLYKATITASGVPSLAQSFFVRPKLATVPAAGGVLSFSAEPGLSAPAQAITISNNGNAPLNVTGTSITGVDNTLFLGAPGSCLTPPFTLAQAQSCTMNIGFTPPAGSSGAKSAMVNIISSDPDYMLAPLVVNLSGTVIPPPVITTSVLPSATAGTSYNTTLAVTGGVAPYTWSIATGTLPPGLALAPSTGLISGIPTTAGAYTFTLMVKDSALAAASLSYALNVVAATPPKVSGTTTYTGTARIYVVIEGTPNGNLGTTIPPGVSTFSIGNVPPGVFPITAFADVKNTGTRHASDPYFTGTVNTTTGDASAAIVFVTPTAPAPVAPAWVNVSPAGNGNGGLVRWETTFDANRAEIADSYTVYWSTSPKPGPGNTTGGGSRNLVASDNAHYILTGLQNGVDYYVAVTATSGAVESAPSPDSGPVRFGAAPVGGVTVSGTISFNGITPTGPLYVVLKDYGNQRMFVTGIISPVSPQAFSIAGVPDGVYRLSAFLDQNNNQIIDAGDYRTAGEAAPIVTVNGAAISGATTSIPASNAVAKVMTGHWRDINTNTDWYNLDFSVSKNLKRPVSVSVSGPNIKAPISIGNTNGFWSWMPLPAGVVPVAGDTYSFDVAYTDGTKETLSAAVTAIVNDFAQPLSPAPNSTVTAGPVFSWAAPVSPPAYAYTYGLSMFNTTASATPTGGQVWYSDASLSSLQTSAPYNFDRQAYQPVIKAGSYGWSVMLRDANGNSSSFSGTQFTLGATSPPTVTATTPASGATNVPLNTTLSITFSDLMDEKSLDTISISGGITGKKSYDPFTRTAKLVPYTPLAPGTTYTATIPATVSSVTGGLLAATTFSFTTGATTQVQTGADGRTTSTVTAMASGASATIQPGTLLTDAAGTPVSGTLTMSTSVMNSMAALPLTASMAHAADGSSLVALGASIDVVLSSMTATVKTLNPPMLVNLAIPSTFAAPGAAVSYYSFDGTTWKPEGTATVKADGTVAMSVTHLSLWAVAQFQKLPTGDLDGNGKIDMADALQALKISVGLVPQAAGYKADGDVAPLVNGKPATARKGYINVGDAIVILQKSLGIVSW